MSVVVVVVHESDVGELSNDRLSASGFSVIAEATTADEAVEAVRGERPDLGSLDADDLGLGGIGSEAAIVVLAAHAPSVVYDDPAVLIDRSSELRLPAIKVAAGRRGEPKLRAAGQVDPDPRDDDLVASVAECFDALGWPYARPEGIPVLLSKLEGPLGRWPFYAHVSARLGVVAFFSVCPVRVPGERRVDAAGLLTSINYALAHGGFELDLADGEVRFKTAMPVDGAVVSQAAVRRLVRTNGIAVESYLPELRAFAAGRLTRTAMPRL
jgi:hypothetical protein